MAEESERGRAMARKEIDEFLADTKRRASEILVGDGYHTPIAFVFPPVGDAGKPPLIIHLGDAIRSPEGKDAVVGVLRTIARRTGAVGVAWILETWISSPGTARDYVPPSQDPLRREALVLLWEFRNPDGGEKVQGMWCRFFHHEGDRVVLGEAQEFADNPGSGRFTGILE